MTVIVVIDDNNGMMFNHRRQSRDRVMIEDIYQMAGGKKLWVSCYSEPLFSESVNVSDNLLEQAGQDDICFIEDQPLQPYLSRINKLVVYRWNRVYPADQHLDISLDEWKKIESCDFEGSSHDRITREEYIRETEKNM